MGNLSGFAREHNYAIADRVVDLAERRGVSPAQIALAWILNKPGITSAVVGVSKMHHMEEAAKAVGITLTEDEKVYLEEAYVSRSVIRIV